MHVCATLGMFLNVLQHWFCKIFHEKRTKLQNATTMYSGCRIISFFIM